MNNGQTGWPARRMNTTDHIDSYVCPHAGNWQRFILYNHIFRVLSLEHYLCEIYSIQNFMKTDCESIVNSIQIDWEIC